MKCTSRWVGPTSVDSSRVSTRRPYHIPNRAGTFPGWPRLRFTWRERGAAERSLGGERNEYRTEQTARRDQDRIAVYGELGRDERQRHGSLLRGVQAQRL